MNDNTYQRNEVQVVTEVEGQTKKVARKPIAKVVQKELKDIAVPKKLPLRKNVYRKTNKRKIIPKKLI